MTVLHENPLENSKPEKSKNPLLAPIDNPGNFLVVTWQTHATRSMRVRRYIP
jgi:hypothetical protein